MLKHTLWIMSALLIVRTALAAPPLAGCSDSDLEIARHFYSRSEAAYKDGNIALIDYLAAESSYLDVELCAGKIETTTYCTRKSAALEKTLDIFKAGNVILGQFGSPVFTTLSQLAELRTKCQ